MKALCISHDPWRQMHKFLRIIISLGKDLMVTLSISMTSMMMTILMTMTLSLMRFFAPESREDPHSGLNNIDDDHDDDNIDDDVGDHDIIIDEVFVT